MAAGIDAATAARLAQLPSSAIRYELDEWAYAEGEIDSVLEFSRTLGDVSGLWQRRS